MCVGVLRVGFADENVEDPFFFPPFAPDALLLA
jgi:hypothetical protein